MFVFDPAAGTWTDGPKLPEAVHHAALVSTPAGLVLVGGYVGDALTVRPPRSGASTTARRPGPTMRHSPMRAARARPPSTAPGSSTPAASSRAASRARSSRRTGDGRGQAIGRLPVAREHLAATSDGAGRTFVLGGRVGGLDSNLAIVDLVEGDDRSATLGELPTQRGGVGGVLVAVARRVPGRWRVAGRDEPPGRVHGADGTLARLPDLGVARHGVGAAVVDGTAYVVLGGRQPGLFTSDVTESIALP